jgi:protease II
MIDFKKKIKDDTMNNIKRLTFTTTIQQYEFLQKIRNAIWVEDGVKVPISSIVHQLIFNPGNNLLQTYRIYEGEEGIL